KGQQQANFEPMKGPKTRQKSNNQLKKS
ncbi:MAG: hypothetical protein JWP82_2947, partial [Humibacillus sp.]|nr:hypothetical protein [Humibacillus sp.]